MEIKVKKYEVKQLVQALQEMSAVSLSIREDYFRAKNLRILLAIQEPILEVQKTKMKDYFEEKATLQATIKDEADYLAAAKALDIKYEAAIKETEAFLSEDISVAVHKMKLSDMSQDLKLPAGVMNYLQLLLEE